MAIEHPTESGTLPSKGLVPIRTVSSLTGVNPVTLRAWERRYGLIKPIRTPKGHRLYTMTDVDLIHQIVALLESGMSIGQVGQVLVTDQPEERDDEAEERSDPWAHYRHRLMQAVVQFDEAILNEIYNEALSFYPVDIVINHLVVPLLRELGWRWEIAQGSIAEEHFFSMFLRNKLGARFHHRNRNLTGPKLLACCMPGEQHEVGILLFSLAAIDRNYRLILLGANTPLEELPPVVERARCQAIILSGSAEVPPQIIQKDLPRLVKAVTVPVFVGGRVTLEHTKILDAVGVISLGDDFNTALRRIDRNLAKQETVTS